VEGFEKVADAGELAPGRMKTTKVGGMEIVVANIDGSFFAVPDRCTHVGGPLGRGKLNGSQVQCPWHGSKFDVKTGAVINGPAARPTTPLQVAVDAEGIWVKALVRVTGPAT
jgi:nitrite reductase/ring-hydroxylating ferredoxin subunit